MKIDLPDINELIKKILSIKNIEQWRKSYIEDLEKNNSLKDIGKFNEFVFGGLLISNFNGNVGKRLVANANAKIHDFTDVKKENIDKILGKEGKSGFRFTQRYNVPIDFLKIFTERYNRDWNKYFDEAKKNYKKNFKEDDILKITGVGPKTRDLALTCFLKEYSANDIHVVRVITRTGLILDGYGDVNIGTDMSDDDNYLFIRELMIKWWNETKYSPGELDRIFWHFGRNICKKNPLCSKCEINKNCLTNKNKINS